MFSSRLSFKSLTLNVPLQLMSRSDKRYRFVLYGGAVADTSHFVYIAHDSTVTPSNGFPVLPTSGGPDWDVTEYGSVVQEEIWGVSVATCVIGVLEVMACDCESEELLRDALGHRAGDKAWHDKAAMRAMGGYR